MSDNTARRTSRINRSMALNLKEKNGMEKGIFGICSRIGSEKPARRRLRETKKPPDRPAGGVMTCTRGPGLVRAAAPGEAGRRAPVAGDARL